MIHFPVLPEGTNVIGVGIDQIEVTRIRESMNRHGEAFLSKVFTPKEKSFCLDRKDPAPCLAARFAAKEAASKALGTGIGKEFGWLDLEVKKGEWATLCRIFRSSAAISRSEKCWVRLA